MSRTVCSLHFLERLASCSSMSLLLGSGVLGTRRRYNCVPEELVIEDSGGNTGLRHWAWCMQASKVTEQACLKVAKFYFLSLFIMSFV